jgi:hypothetical protein
MPAVIIELMETLKNISVYISFRRRRSKLNKKIKTPSYKKISNTLL